MKTSDFHKLHVTDNDLLIYAGRAVCAVTGITSKQLWTIISRRFFKGEGMTNQADLEILTAFEAAVTAQQNLILLGRRPEMTPKLSASEAEFYKRSGKQDGN